MRHPRLIVHAHHCAGHKHRQQQLNCTDDPFLPSTLACLRLSLEVIVCMSAHVLSLTRARTHTLMHCAGVATIGHSRRGSASVADMAAVGTPGLLARTTDGNL